MRRGAAVLGLVLLLLVSWREASGYGHFVRYVNGNGNGGLRAALTRFDLRALPGKKVPYYIEARGPDVLAEGDSRVALFSQIQSAAEVWNTVKTSELRLTFGGLLQEGATVDGPRIEIIFDEIPPGLIAMAGPEVLGDVAEENGVPFVPIVKSMLVLPANLAEPARPSWSERLYQTMVHEMGHTLGLQHSWASGTMSTEITRATTKGLPLAADDVAGISVLYPTRAFREESGSISGRVLRSSNGAPVALASVVAFTPVGDAVSALTGPDGSYKIEGLAPGSYFLYAQPLPPSLAGEPQPVNLDLPVGPEGRIQPGDPFNLTFYPGTANPDIPIEVRKGQTNEEITFWVASRERVTVHSVQTYRFFGQQAVKPAFFHQGAYGASMVLFGYGLSTQTGPVGSLTASILRAPETLLAPGPFAYAPAPSYLQMNFQVPEDAPPGPRHLLFRVNGESHVAPSAYRVAKRMPPALEEITGNEDGTVTLAGSNLATSTGVRFDGAAAEILERDHSRLRVRPPGAPGGHTARVSVFDEAGQSSAMLDGGALRVYTYPAAPDGAVSLSPAYLAPGVEAVLEIKGEATKWNGALKAAFNSGEVSVLRLWTLSPQRALAHVHVSHAARSLALDLTIANGMSLTTAPRALNLHPAGVLQLYLVTSSMLETPATAGGELLLPVGNLRSPLFVATTEVRIGGEAASILAVNGSTAVVRVPKSLQPGVALVEMKIQGEAVLPGAVLIVPDTPSISSVQTLTGVAVSSQNAPAPGDTIRIHVTGLPEGLSATGGIEVLSEGLRHEVTAIESSGGGHLLTVRLSGHTPRAATAYLVISYLGAASDPVPVPIL